MALALCSAFLFITPLSSNSQDLTSTELLDRGYVGAWTNTVGGANGGYSGGWTPAYNAGTDTVIFGYTTSTVSQTKAISTALQGTGIQVTGYNYAWKINNADSNTGTLSATVSLKNSAGNVVESYGYNYNATTSGLSENFQQFSGTQNFSQIYGADTLGSITVAFTGKDNRYWAGYYGPRVRDPHLSLNYRSDPCATNPAFGPQCAGFNDLVTSINLVPYPNAVATGSNYVDNTFPIATVLSSSGSGLALHGFKYGFVYDLKDPYCSSTFLGIFCTGTTDSVARVSAGATDASGRLVFNNNHVFQGANTGPQEMNYQYLFPTSTNTNLMGNFHFSAQVEGNGSIYNMYSKMIVTPDPCMKNVMYSSSCTGFQEAIDKLNGTNKTDYATTGYTEPASVTAGTASADSITFTSSPTGSTVQAPAPVAGPVPQQSVASSTSSASVSASVASVASTTEKSSVSGPGLGFAMSLISKNAEKEKSIAMTASANAVAEAQAAGTQAQQEAVATAAKMTEASGGSAMTMGTSASSQMSNDVKTASSGGGLNIQSFAGMGSVQMVGVAQQQSVFTTSTSTSQIMQQSFAPAVNYSIAPTQQVASMSVAPQPTFIDTIQSNTTAFVSFENKQADVEAPSNMASFLLDRTNPLREIIEGQPLNMSSSMEQQMSTVKKDVAPNDLAGGVDLTKMAIAPTGYNAYLSLTMRDVSFYAPRDMYPRQNNVDNVRALRQLSSDRIHQEMVNQQYQGR